MPNDPPEGAPLPPEPTPTPKREERKIVQLRFVEPRADAKGMVLVLLPEGTIVQRLDGSHKMWKYMVTEPAHVMMKADILWRPCGEWEEDEDDDSA